MLEKDRAASGGGRGGRAALGEGITIAQLRTMVKGPVIAPGDAGYDAARTVFYGGIDQRPAVIDGCIGRCGTRAWDRPRARRPRRRT
jgi:hypothetical protein